jgi:hypothetical protein
MARLSPAKQAQLDQLQAEAAEPDEGPQFSAREILHELANVTGRHNLHDSIARLPDSYDIADEPEGDDSAEGDPNPLLNDDNSTKDLGPTPKGV